MSFSIEDQPDDAYSASRDSGASPWLPLALFIALGGIFGIVMVGSPDRPGREVALADIGSIADGQQVQVQGFLSEILGERTMTIDDSGAPAPVLVLVRRIALPQPGEAAAMVETPGAIQVRGTVRTFGRAVLASELDLALDRLRFSHWEGEPVIVADELVSVGPSA